ncbi:Protein phosphatase 2C-like protein 2 [Colletotrichum fructicola]|uniref:Protein phosphatase 2C homolog 2 n=1 Tax=Colletotrichum fructicola (strain Nara gc5) TaxID=1213859 RepID=L2FM13_COLFN|nr:Protein phosphatase 2C 2 [Colletotrichum fructicola]KAF4486411.1 Protein phosphatase 2C-like protein 2 [Colletotrichum fructicola Nara gc5]KAE9583313.1 Protein phosphatase 2C 2 [Colletotrichum fructicola]KAF4425849.1 Protein phosphatase 2C-like protein 2 [Colletotrichum fructicola]KAF4903374.1 Protein phosphatase 2C-like protein 2 [Colletotrichum fructicola]KAF4912949.1 Protein phosphatase 2C-like protein 2 [Colletotrichum fructicola]
MGQTLSEPVVEKNSAKGEDERLLYGVSAMQGWRISMEDAHITVLDLLAPGSDEAKKHDSKLSFFGVFDGHGGDKVALFAGEHIHEIIKKQETFKKGNYEQALKDGFLATDRAILNDPKYEEEVSGCTACVGLISDNKIYVANAGDSRSVLGIKGRAKPLSQDHKPQLEAEKSRITAAGGFVDFGRVNGNLALSRAIGDFEFKKSAELSPEAQIVTAFPDVEVHEITDDDEFLVIACDGIWDCQSSQAVVEFVRRGIAAKQDLEKICENMMDNCLASNSETGGVGCDNMTMVIVGLLRGKTKEEWYEEIAKRVAAGDGPCAPPEYAEFRGPGVHHNFDDSDSGYDVDLENKGKPFGIGGYKGRIIFLGDGTEVLTDSDDTEMFDNAEEDKDLESQVSKATSTTIKDSNAEESAAKKPEEESKTGVEKPKEESKPAAAPAASTEAQTTESKEK